MKILKNIIKASFKKIRIRESKLPPNLQLLFLEKEELRKKLATSPNLDTTSIKEQLDITKAKIADICAEKNRNIVNGYLGRTTDTFEGYSQAKTW